MKKKSVLAGVIFAAVAAGVNGAGAEEAPGGRMPDGSVYAGVSSRTGLPFYTTPENAPGRYGWDGAAAYCRALSAHGHNDWRLPDAGEDGGGELGTLFRNREAIGGFGADGAGGGRYWSATQNPFIAVSARMHSLNSGKGGWAFKSDRALVRCVRP